MASTNKMIDTLTANIGILEQDEIAFLKYVAENGPTLDADQKTFLEDRIRNCTDFLNENISLLNKITEVQAENHLKFLDADPYPLLIEDREMNDTTVPVLSPKGKRTKRKKPNPFLYA